MGELALATRTRRDVAAVGWSDALIEWVGRLPVPAWFVYGALTLVLLAYAWLFAALNGKEFHLGNALVITQAAIPFALGHHFTDAARQALRRFRPLLAVDDARYAGIERDFLTLSPRATRIATAIGFAMGILTMVVTLAPGLGSESFFLPYASSREAVFFGLGPVFIVLSTAFGPFLYRAFRQLARVSRFHASAPAVDPLRPGPTYAFSNLTVRIGLALLLYGYAWLIADSESGASGFALAFGSDLLIIALSFAFFIVPLWGMHRRLLAARDALLDAADSRLEVTTTELHRRVDALDLRDADPLNKTIASLIMERDVLLKAPTWPWHPGTLNLFVSVLAAPIALFVVTRLLGRFF